MKDCPAVKPKRCAIYARKSTTQGLEQEFNTLNAQIEACRHYIQSQAHLGWEECPEVFSDGGFSGANTKRPAFSELLSKVVEGFIDVVLVYKVDRLSRSLLDFSKIMEIFNDHDVAFVSITQNFSTATAMGRLTLNILMSFSEFEREVISERTQDKIEASRQKGKWTGGIAPLGYEIKDHKLQIVANEVDIVRLMFDWSLAGHSTTWIAERFNDLGIEHKYLIRPRPRPWNRVHIGKMLRNRLYAGLLGCKGGGSSNGEHEAIISKEMFEHTQIMLSPQVRRYRSLALNPAYIARGILVCSTCGRQMSTSCHWYGLRQIRYYRCATQGSDGKAACPNQNQRADKIESDLIEKLRVELGKGYMGVNIEKYQMKYLRREVKKAGEAMVRTNCDDDQPRLNVGIKTAVLAKVRKHIRWFSKTAACFDTEWPTLTFPEKNRFLRTLLRHVLVNRTTGNLDLAFRDFSGSLYVPEEIG